MNEIYRKEPFSYENDVPVFLLKNEYILNYEKISSDHLSQMKDGVDNPWISENEWLTIENSTRKLIQKYSH